ncbi:hypothetical protein U14_02900 [Candidatus Moduliflexus flocculans]|uniref:DUF5615 domain-containing protein n=1 Tax=Candidatus Moduliflexus flocculans TaxID=1499966 RepID=A0A081BMN9_9BACT|nr:hypothetical protein U14_02900 [Candidatus Moduliflexus flocculans]
MSAIRFLLDENVAPLFRAELARREPAMIVWKVGDPGLPPNGTLDPEILCWCEEQGFVLVTNNRKSMPDHLAAHREAGRHIPGILELNPKMSIGETIDELILIWGASEPDDYRDMIVYLPLS